MTGEIIFSIILPVCHGGNFLRDAIASLHQLKFPLNEFEVIVVGSVSDEESYKTVTEEASSANYAIIYMQCDSDNRSAKLNAACAVAHGRFLAFADDDCIFMPDWLQKINNVLEHESNVGIIGGKDSLINSHSSFNLALDHVLNCFIGTGGLRRRGGLQTGKYYPKLWNMAVPYNVAMAVALKPEQNPPQIFNEFLIVHEDVDLVNRIEQSGKRIVFSSEVRIGHSRDTTFLSFVRRNFTMARTSRTLGTHSLPHSVMSGFLLGTAIFTSLSFLMPSLSAIPLIIMGVYLVILLASAIEGLLSKKKIKMLVLVPILLASLHFARGLGYLFPLHIQTSQMSE